MRASLLLAIAAAATLLHAEEPKTAGQVYKNVTQLKDTPADQLFPAMQFISASLGVECGFCHVQGKMELDDKPEKKTAREMMAMTAALNKNSFGGRREVTCYSCHHGAAHPAGVPAVRESDAAERREATPAGAAPTADEVLQRYVAAAGGAEALHRITSREMKGKITANGSEMAIEVIAKAPNKRISITHGPGGESFTAFDGTAGWMGSTGRPARPMAAAESAAASLDAEFYLPLRLKEIYPQLRRVRPGEVNGVECETLLGTAPDRPAVRLFFDRTSGLLVRAVRYAETPLGRLPTQIDYADYRDAGGVKIPYRWTLARPNGRFTIQITDVTSNAPVDDARFARPAGDVGR